MGTPSQDWESPSLEPLEEFKCTFENCDKVFKNAKDLRRHKIDDLDHDYCKKCDLDFASDLKHIIHRIATPSKHSEFASLTCWSRGLTNL